MSEPRSLSEVEQQQNVFHAGSVWEADVTARKAFVDIFHQGHDADHDVTSTFLFEENGQRVYKYCMNPQAAECVYVIMKEGIHFGE